MTAHEYRLLFRARWATRSLMRRHRVWAVAGNWRDGWRVAS